METQDLAAEEALLSSVWLSADADGFLDRIESKDFTDPLLQWLLLLLKLTADAGDPLDMIAVLRRARKPEMLERLPRELQGDMAAHVARVLERECTSAHTGYYFRVVRQARLNRALVGLMAGIRERLNKRHEPAAIIEFIALNTEKLRERLP